MSNFNGPRNGDYAAYVAELDKRRAAANAVTPTLDIPGDAPRSPQAAARTPRKARPLPESAPYAAGRAASAAAASRPEGAATSAQAQAAQGLAQPRRTRSLWLAPIGVVMIWHGAMQIIQTLRIGHTSWDIFIPGGFTTILGLILLRSAFRLRRLARTNAPVRTVRGPNGDTPDPSGGG